MSDLFIRHIGLLVTPRDNDRDARHRPVQRIREAAILIRDGRIAEIGPESAMSAPVDPRWPVLDAGGALALPGLIDCHTHPVFVGNRADEFHRRNAGQTYLQIAAAGGGIQASARKVLAAAPEKIVEESLPRFQRSLMAGVTTMECKSGYGLTWEGEHKLLSALIELERQIPQRMQRTFLVHALPIDFGNDRWKYVSDVVSRMIPMVARDGLASTVDVFCEEGAFTVAETRRILLSAREHGLRLAIHANQFGHSGGALLAAELGAQSAHHLEYLNDEEIERLAAAGVIAVILPACVFFLGTLPYPPARKMIERGLRVAIATDMNPGSSMTESLPFCLTAAAIYCKMSPEELLWSVTLDAARVLGMDSEVGSLEIGKWGDVSLWTIPDLESLSYHLGSRRAAAVIIGGRLAWEDRDATARY